MKRLQVIRFLVQAIFLVLSIVMVIGRYRILGLVYLITAFLFGVFYCGWLCPYGFAQDIFGKLGSLFLKRKLKMPQGLQRYLIFLRYILTVLFMVLAAKQLFNFHAMDSRIAFLQIIQWHAVQAVALGIMFVFLMVAVFFDRPFCNYFCTEAARYGILSLARIFTIKRNEDSCTHCEKCTAVCPMQIQVSEKKRNRNAQCVNCFQCISHCPSKALTYGLIHFNKNSAKKINTDLNSNK
jgi:polyferredoxin